MDLKSEAKTFNQRAYIVVKSQEKLLKTDLKHLIDNIVLEYTGEYNHEIPTFIVMKKTQRDIWESYFRYLNKYLVKKQFTLPKIGDILENKQENFLNTMGHIHTILQILN